MAALGRCCGRYPARPRSDGEGDAFLQAIVPHVTSGPGRDNLAGVEAIKAMGIVDETRIGVSGWSGGGLQTGWLVGHASYWRAAVAGAGVTRVEPGRVHYERGGDEPGSIEFDLAKGGKRQI